MSRGLDGALAGRRRGGLRTLRVRSKGALEGALSSTEERGLPATCWSAAAPVGRRPRRRAPFARAHLIRRLRQPLWRSRGRRGRHLIARHPRHYRHSLPQRCPPRGLRHWSLWREYRPLRQQGRRPSQSVRGCPQMPHLRHLLDDGDTARHHLLVHVRKRLTSGCSVQ